MKRRLTWIAVMAVLLAALLCLTVGASAEGATSGTCGDNLAWTLDENGLLTISGSGEMTSHPWNAADVKSVVIEEGVTSIGSSAFSDCSNLTSITLPESLTSIEYYAFYNCSSLTNITIGSIESWLTIIYRDYFGYPNYKSSNCHLYIGDEEITSVIVPEGITSIREYAFYNCNSLTSITIPEGVTSIGGSAFSNCSSLTSITLPEGVTSIGSSAFAYCSSLKSITLPESLTSIGGGVFTECRLKNITIGSIESWLTIIFDNRDSYPNYSSTNCHLYIGDEEITNITVPEGVTSIRDYAFTNFSFLTSITLPEGVTSIGNWAFRNCGSLTSIKLPDGVTSLPANAFWNCTNLKSVTLPEGVTSIGNAAFGWCSSLTSITLREGVISIDNLGFGWCGSLTSIALPESLTSIGSSAFIDCNSLTDVYYAGTEAQWNEIIIASGNECLTSATIHYNSQSPELVIIDSGTWGNLAWTLDENNVLTISGEGDMDHFLNFGSTDAWHAHKTEVVEIKVEEGITSLGYRAFESFTALEEIILPESLTTITEWAINGCRNLTAINIPANVTEIGRLSLSNNAKLTAINVHKDNLSFASQDGVLFDKDKKSLIYYPNGKAGVYTIPDGVEHIGAEAFYWSHEITGVNIPDSVNIIDEKAFRTCTKLADVVIPNGVSSIRTYTFANNTSLHSITIPVSVTQIADNAFNNAVVEDVYYGGTEAEWEAVTIDETGNDGIKNATVHFEGEGEQPAVVDSGTCGENLTWTLDENGLLTISGTGEMADYTWTEKAPWDANRELINKIAVEDGVTVIGAYAFCESVNLTEVILPESVSEIRSSAFDSCSGLTEIDLPDGIDCIADHLFGRCTSLANLIIPQQVTSIEAGAFIECTSLTEIIIPDNVLDIDISAFADCTGLTEIVLPEGLTQIHEWVFAGCSGLASVTIPSSVTYIGSGAFKECSQLTDVYYPGTIDQWNAIGIDPEDNSALINANVHCIRNILTLPADLSTIESEAFANLNEAEAVRIHGGEITIADDAFDTDVVIIAPADSPAINWAIDHDRNYIEE